MTETTMSAPDKQIAESPFGIHEALHTCSVLMDTFGLRVAEHPAVALRPAILAKAEDAIERMMDVYQALGALPEWHKDITTPNGDEVREALEALRLCIPIIEEEREVTVYSHKIGYPKHPDFGKVIDPDALADIAKYDAALHAARAALAKEKRG